MFYSLSEEIIDELKNRLRSTEQDYSKSRKAAANMPQTLNDFYSELNHLNFEWETREAINNGSKILGRIKILPAEQVLGSWEGIVYFKNIDHYDYMEKFKIVDFFIGEACVGFQQTDNNVDYMEYLDLGNLEAQPLSLTFEGYYQLMMMARGFLYWQRVILNLNNGSGYEPLVEKFKTYMPQLFPDFKWEDFVALYEKVKIK